MLIDLNDDELNLVQTAMFLARRVAIDRAKECATKEAEAVYRNMQARIESVLDKLKGAETHENGEL